MNLYNFLYKLYENLFYSFHKIIKQHNLSELFFKRVNKNILQSPNFPVLVYINDVLNVLWAYTSFTIVLNIWLCCLQCDSPYIIKFYSAFFVENRISICTEFMDGESHLFWHLWGIWEAAVTKESIIHNMWNWIVCICF